MKLFFFLLWHYNQRYEIKCMKRDMCLTALCIACCYLHISCTYSIYSQLCNRVFCVEFHMNFISSVFLCLSSRHIYFYVQMDTYDTDEKKDNTYNRLMSSYDATWKYLYSVDGKIKGINSINRFRIRQTGKRVTMHVT